MCKSIGFTVTSACTLACVPVKSCQLLACHRHGDWAVPYMARASSSLHPIVIDRSSAIPSHTYYFQKHNVRMKLQLLQMIQIFNRAQDRIMFGCGWCVGVGVCVVFVCTVCVVWYVWVCVVGEGGVCVVCCACVLRVCVGCAFCVLGAVVWWVRVEIVSCVVLCVFVECVCVCGMCVLCFGVVVCCVVMCVGVQCVVSGVCGVSAWCVLCVRCGVCGVWRGLAREKLPVCRFQTPPCVPAKRAHVFNMCAWCRHTRRRFEHYTWRRFEPTEPLSLSPSLSLVPSFSLPSFSSFSLSLVLFLRSLPSLFFSFSFSALFSSLSNNDNDHSSSGLSLCTHGSDLPECQSAWASVHSLFGDYVRTMQETTVLA